MTNPFLEIPIEIYERHMSLDSVLQLQTLNMIMRDQLDRYDVSTSMILGVAGGNGLEHVDVNKFDVVYGVDINERYLETCRQRFSYLGAHFKELCLDLSDLSASLPKSELIIADLIVEYTGYEAFACHMQRIRPKYISVVIQINQGDEFVSDSPYLHAFDRVAEIHHQMEETELKHSLGGIGYSCILIEEYPLPNGKLFKRFDFADMENEERKVYKMEHITRDDAFLLLKKYNKDPFHIQHALTVEAVMKWYAKELEYGEEAEYWGVVGLLHDIDFEQYPDEHCIKAPELLREGGAGEDIIHSVVSHGYGITVGCGVTIDVAPEHEMEKVLFAADELTGLIWAAALMRPSRSTKDMELKSLKKKYKSKGFAAGCSREVIERGADQLGWELDKLLEMTLRAMAASEDIINQEMEKESGQN